MMEVAYATREEVKAALDVAETARINQQIDREILAASRSIEGDLKRFFYPLIATQTFDWPDHQFTTPWKLWLNEWEMCGAPTQVLAAGVDITSSVLPRPDGALSRSRPYTKLEVNLSSSAAFNAGSTFQRSISVTGPFGFCADEVAGGSMSTAFTDTVGTAGTCSDGSLVGVLSLIRVDSERMIVTGKAMASTSQTITAPVGAVNNNNVITVSGGSFDQNEVIMIDAEKMRVDDVTGTQLTVTRPWDGTILAQHNANATVYAARALTVQRGVLGTTAATHSSAAAINVHVVPSLIRDLCVAETISTLSQVRHGYTQAVRRSGGDPKEAREVATALDDLRKRVFAAYARQMRTRTAARLV
ncbi:MAG TPA: hypothetical protein VFQ42_04040 [Mycobacterium sp.]|nr:hypothetical protein [Mycobacterium sp.]